MNQLAEIWIKLLAAGLAMMLSTSLRLSRLKAHVHLTASVHHCSVKKFSKQEFISFLSQWCTGPLGLLIGKAQSRSLSPIFVNSSKSLAQWIQCPALGRLNMKWHDVHVILLSSINHLAVRDHWARASALQQYSLGVSADPILLHSTLDS